MGEKRTKEKKQERARGEETCKGPKGTYKKGYLVKGRQRAKKRLMEEKRMKGEKQKRDSVEVASKGAKGTHRKGHLFKGELRAEKEACGR